MDLLVPQDAQAIERAVNVLRAGGVILYPTDTLYGLGADAFSDSAVEKIYAIKGREEGKPIHAIVSDLAMAEKYGEIDDRVYTLIEKFPKGKITCVVKKKSNVVTGIASGVVTFGFRIPDNDFCIALTRAFGGPITATSANKSGEQPMMNVVDILKQLGTSASALDLAIDAGLIAQSEPSTVVDLTDVEPKVLREGAISASEILNFIKG